MNLRVIFYLLGFTFLLACSPQKKDNSESETQSSQDQLYEEVMEIHDEVMPKMQDIMNLKEQIRSKIDSIASMEDSSNQQVKELEELITRLDEADEAMMNWMRQFNRDYEEMSQEEIVAYLKAEKKKISTVKEKMTNTIVAAERATK